MAKHTAPGDPSFRASLLRNVGGGAALVIVVALLFLALGQISREPGAPEVAGGDDRESADPDAAEDEADEEQDPAEDEETARDDGTDEPAADGEADDAGDTPDDAPADAQDGDDGGEDEGEAEPSDDEEAEPSDEVERIAPSEIDVQVLDGAGDGGAAADRVAAELGEAGYRIIAQNPALAYDATAVLWTAGNEARARQVAEELGAAEVRAQPGNLSESVDVHVVVGDDRA